MLAVRVQMLDDSVTMFQVQVSDIWVFAVVADVDPWFEGKISLSSPPPL
jgi:hypothetical protein